MLLTIFHQCALRSQNSARSPPAPYWPLRKCTILQLGPMIKERVHQNLTLMLQCGEICGPSNRPVCLSDAKPGEPCQLETSVARTGCPSAVSPADTCHGYNDMCDYGNDFQAAHVACVPLTGDCGATVGVLTVMRGWPRSAPPPMQIIWSEAKYAPFSRYARL